MTQMLELSDKDFIAARIEMLQQVITKTLEMNEKAKTLSKEREDKEESNGNFRTEKHINQKKNDGRWTH